MATYNSATVWEPAFINLTINISLDNFIILMRDYSTKLQLFITISHLKLLNNKKINLNLIFFYLFHRDSVVFYLKNFDFN